MSNYPTWSGYETPFWLVFSLFLFSQYAYLIMRLSGWPIPFYSITTGITFCPGFFAPVRTSCLHLVKHAFCSLCTLLARLSTVLAYTRLSNSSLPLWEVRPPLSQTAPAIHLSLTRSASVPGIRTTITNHGWYVSRVELQ